MAGVAYYIVFILCSVAMAVIFFEDFLRHEQIAIGLSFGIALSAWLPSAFALALGKYSILAHMLALALLLCMTALVVFRGCKKGAGFRKSLLNKDRKTEIILAMLLTPFMVLMAVLFSGHILTDPGDGLYGGQCSYGDLSMHMGMVTSIANQQSFPPDYSILPGQRLCYPFLVNAQSASMLMMGTSLRMSIIIPSLVMSLSCFLGFFSLARMISQKNSAGVAAFLLFFITGGLGFLFFLNDSQMFRQIFTGYYMTPTNHSDFSLNLRWVNVIADMMLPQRTTLMGWSVVMGVFLLLTKALEKEKVRLMASAGLLASLLPMIHTHTFLALGILCAGLLATGLADRGRKLFDRLRLWAVFLIPVIVFSTPQLLFWIFNQGGSFVSPHLDWVNTGDNWLWFWIKNIGLPFILIVPAFLWGYKKYYGIYLSATLIFIIAEFLTFQPNYYDNNKLMLVWYMFTCILVGDYIIELWRAIRAVPGKYILAAALAVLLFASGTLTLVREVASNGEYMLYSSEEVKTAQVIERGTPPDSLFLTGTQHLNAPAALAGRDILVGSAIYLYFHGLSYTDREAAVNHIYSGGGDRDRYIRDYGIDYIYLSHYERANYGAKDEYFANYPVVFSGGGITIFAASGRAISAGALQ